jgi:Mg2+ and Co2+ transporter CorA
VTEQELIERRLTLWDLRDATQALARKCGLSSAKAYEYTEPMAKEIDGIDERLNAIADRRDRVAASIAAFEDILK